MRNLAFTLKQNSLKVNSAAFHVIFPQVILKSWKSQTTKDKAYSAFKNDGILMVFPNPTLIIGFGCFSDILFASYVKSTPESVFSPIILVSLALIYLIAENLNF